MGVFVIRRATINDVPFLVETIIEAEKSGTNILSYTTIFGLAEDDVKKYLTEMLLEEIDGCELSISSFNIAEIDGKIAGATSVWIEGIEEIPAVILKGNLLSYTLPKKCIELSITLNEIIRDIHIDYIMNTLQLGLVYVSAEYRGMNLVVKLIKEQINYWKIVKPELELMYVQVFDNNIGAIKAYQKVGFEIISEKSSANIEIIKLLPSNKKVLMKLEIKNIFDE